jgi:hypothetical protein
MAQFVGQLRPNEIFAALYNMIISQQVFADNISSTQSELVNMSKVDGTLYGDTKLFYSTDILGSDEWGNDSEAENLLALHRPQAPEVQAIVIDNFRQIALTTDEYLSKRAWGDAAAFGQFMSVMQGWIGETKDVYEAKMFNTFIGTNTAEGPAQNITKTLPTDENVETQSRLQAQAIARDLANLYVNLADASRDYNDNGNYRSFSKEDMIVVWNSEYVNEITKMDLPTIFHKDGLVDGFKYVLPAKFFGTILTVSATLPSNETNLKVRSYVEKDYNTVPPSSPDYVKSLHIFPGDLIPAGQAYKAYEAYEEDSKIVFKMYHKDAVPFMSAFEVGTSFFNAKSLTENRYLTWGYSTLENLDNYPLITYKVTE